MSTASDNIFLIGPMGAGKSTIGRRLAKSLSKSFVDADHELEQRTGVSISTIFDIEGEDGFRKRETQLIKELAQRQDVVLATGGGAVLAKENREALIKGGFVVYLYAPLAQLLERTRKDTSRPLLQTDDPETKFRKILTEREPLYKETADLTINTAEMNAQQTIKTIKSAMA